ncbi:MAG TPA: hypothetical protein VJZ27_06315, partial [Aggregatilineales bacterium]|nr:hypothetical protein [Aggregatilineales bacterium]
LWWQNLNDYPTPAPVTPTATQFPTLTPPRDTIEGAVDFAGIFSYQIHADALQDVNIAVIGQAGFDPVLRVIDPAGNIVIVVDDVTGSQDPRTGFTAGPSGLYTIEVSGFEGAAGAFTLNYIVQ